jgi:hypothetical protein
MVRADRGTADGEMVEVYIATQIAFPFGARQIGHWVRCRVVTRAVGGGDQAIVVEPVAHNSAIDPYGVGSYLVPYRAKTA